MKCFACGKTIRSNAAPAKAYCDDDQDVFVGPDCYKKVLSSSIATGYQPPKGGPRLWARKEYTPSRRKS